jgi:membrane protein
VDLAVDHHRADRAELNAETEHQTVRDTATGRPEPLGARGPRMADTIEAPQE